MMKLWRVLSAFAAFAAAAVSSYAAGPADWLLDPSPYVASVDFNETSRELTLTNGLVSRRVLLAPNAATVSLRNLATGEEFVRALAPEARVTLDGKEYPVAATLESPAGSISEDLIHGLYAQTVSLMRPFNSSAAQSVATNRYPQSLSYPQRIR